MSHSPSTLNNENAHLGSLQEEPFDISFPCTFESRLLHLHLVSALALIIPQPTLMSVLDPVGGMQYFASATSTPAPPAAEEATITPRVIPPNHMQPEGDRPEHQEGGTQDQKQPDDVNMSWQSSSKLCYLSSDLGQTAYVTAAEAIARPFQYPPYAHNPTAHLEGLSLHSTSAIGDSIRPFNYSTYSTSYHFGTPVRPTFHPYRSCERTKGRGSLQ